MLRMIKLKVFLVFITMHTGLGFLVYSLFRSSELRQTDPTLFYSLAIGISGLYGGLLLGGLFLYLPIAPWIDRINYIRNWRAWILQELPMFMALVPILAGLFALVKAAFGDLRSMKRKGNLDWKHLKGFADRWSDDFAKSIHAAREHMPWDHIENLGPWGQTSAKYGRPNGRRSHSRNGHGPRKMGPHAVRRSPKGRSQSRRSATQSRKAA